MSAGARTGIYVAAAAVLVLLALVTAPSIEPSGELVEEGELFFPDFTDPEQAESLEVYQIDQASMTAKVFKVNRKDGLWTIPSHYDYPADAKKKMAEAAAMLIGLRKGTVRSDSRSDDAALGVVDPRDPETDIEGRGKLVIFRGEGGEEIAQLIIGKEVEGRDGQRFVREPGKRRTYTAKIDAEVSTKFADWVETDLLKLSAYDVERIVFDNYSVDEAAGVLRPGERIVAEKKDGDWRIEGQAEDEEVKEDEIQAATRALDDLKIVGVRPKPGDLSEKLASAQGFDRALQIRSLQRRGYFLARGRIYSNEGDLIVTTKNGVRYELKFGEIVYGGADEVSAGSDEKEEGEAGGDAKKEGRPNRFLLVMVDFDEDWFPKPDGSPIPAEEVAKRRTALREIREIAGKIDKVYVDEGELPGTLAEVVPEDDPLGKDPWDHPYAYEKKGDEYLVVSLGSDGEPGGEAAAADIASNDLDAEETRLKQADEWKSREEKVEAGKKEAAELAKRFGPWYYVIDAELFDKLKLSRADLLEKQEPEKAGNGGGAAEEPADDGPSGEKTTGETEGGGEKSTAQPAGGADDTGEKDGK